MTTSAARLARLTDTPGTYTALGYVAATKARESGALYTAGSADWHIRYDREDLINQSRAFCRDNVLYNRVIRAAVDNILGPDGFTLRVKTSNSRLNQRVEDAFRAWGEDPEVRGLWDWNTLQRLVLEETIAAGDIGLVKVRSEQRLQLVESENIYSPTGRAPSGALLEQGVELDGLGRPVAFWVVPTDPDTGFRAFDMGTRYSEKDLLFVTGQNLTRATQTRGVPTLVPSFPNFHRINDVLNSEARAWQILARFVGMVSKKNAPAVGYSTSSTNTNLTTSERASRITDRIHEIPEGLLIWGEDGDSVSAVQQSRPSQNFEKSIKVYTRFLGMPIGVPLSLILFDWSDSNYSSARAELESAFRAFQRWQKALIRQFHARVYRWFVGTRFSGERKLPDLLTQFDFITPTFPWIDQLKEIEAWRERLDANLTTHADAAAATGQDRAELNAARQQEFIDAYASAKAVEDATDGAIEASRIWHHFAAVSMGKTEAAYQIDSNPGAESGTDDDDESATPAPGSDSDENGDDA